MNSADLSLWVAVFWADEQDPYYDRILNYD